MDRQQPLEGSDRVSTDASLKSERDKADAKLQDKPARPERLSTDTSLKNERTNTDAKLVSARVAIEEKADEVLQTARRRADRVLSRSREREDASDASIPRRVSDQRDAADALVEAERERSDARLETERGAAELVEVLLRIEREETDHQLLQERDRSDWLLSTQDDFLAMVSHDLRNLLTNVSLNAARIVRTAPENAAGLRIITYADQTQWAVVRAQRLLHDLTDVVAISAGKLHMEVRPGDLRPLLLEVADSFLPAAEAAGIRLRVPEPGPPVRALFDAERLAQVLGNLVSNALKFTPRGGSLTINAERVESFIQLEVRDTGVGIPPEKLETVFERFKQVSADRRGLGLGLYICRTIAEAQGGTIRAISAPGQGSTFVITLRPA
jgi:signal transduction histidine kinase